MSLMKKIFLSRIPRRAHASLHRWANGVVIPLLFVLGGTYRALTTAATPFEEYLGIVATAALALGWAAVFVHALRVRPQPAVAE